MPDVCPWWAGYFIDNPLRRWLFAPEKTLSPFVRPGMTALDVGCGMGVNSLAMARLVGPQGRVIAADMQPRMLAVLAKRAAHAGLTDRIRTHLSAVDSLGVSEPVDFALACWMVHETPDQFRFFGQVRECLAAGAKFLVIEPTMHVSEAAFRVTLELAGAAGLNLAGRIPVRLSRAALLERA